MNRRQKTLLKRVVSVFVPVLIFLVLAVVGTNAYIVYQMLHPPRRPVINTPNGYEQLLQKPIWDEKTWAGARGQEMKGWLLYQDHAAPVIILSHGYASNREEMLRPSFELWSAGYNVLAYDLRGHGASSATQSSLGAVELADLRATIEWAQKLTDDQNRPLCDGRLGLYGADLGGYISLSAAAREPAVRAVAVDTIYPTQADYLKYQTKRLLGTKGRSGSSWAEGRLEQTAISWLLGVMSNGGGITPLGVPEAMALMGDRPVLMIQGRQDEALFELAVRAAALAPGAQSAVMDRSRAANNSLFREDAETYDRALVTFFTGAPGFAPPPPSKHAVDERRRREALMRDVPAPEPAPPAE